MGEEEEAVDDVTMDEPRATAHRAPCARTDLPCGECQAPMVLRKASQGHLYYLCSRFPECRGSHSAYPDGRPQGVPGSRQTAEARKRVHEVFDRLWKSGIMTRATAYAWMRKVLSLDKDAHIGTLAWEQCERLMDLVRQKYPSLKTVWERLRDNPYEGVDLTLGPKEEAKSEAKKPYHARLICGGCGRWMKSGPPTAKTPATRRPPPHANRCTDCPKDRCDHKGPCNQPEDRHPRPRGRRWWPTSASSGEENPCGEVVLPERGPSRPRFP